MQAKNAARDCRRAASHHKHRQKEVFRTSGKAPPFAPHIADELWEIIGNTTFTFEEEWPTFEEELTKEHKMNLVVQINGKIRETIPAKIGLTKEEYEKLAFDSEKIKKAVEGKEVVKVIVVPNKLVNIVVKG